MHGDIKPENILVARSQEPIGYGIKVTDFGYSCLGSNDEDLVMLPQSKPWQAPEYHSRWFSLQLAKKMDIYSLGLLCLWLLFPGKNLVSINLPNINVGFAFAGEDENAEKILEMFKKENQVSTSTLYLLSQEGNLSQDARSCLQGFFIGALHHDPSKRDFDMNSFIERFSDYDDGNDDLGFA